VQEELERLKKDSCCLDMCLKEMEKSQEMYAVHKDRSLCCSPCRKSPHVNQRCAVLSSFGVDHVHCFRL